MGFIVFLGIAAAVLYIVFEVIEGNKTKPQPPTYGGGSSPEDPEGPGKDAVK